MLFCIAITRKRFKTLIYSATQCNVIHSVPIKLVDPKILCGLLWVTESRTFSQLFNYIQMQNVTFALVFRHLVNKLWLDKNNKNEIRHFQAVFRQ